MSEAISIREAARQLGVDRGTVYRYVRDGWLANRGTPEHPRVILEEARAAGIGVWGRRRKPVLDGGDMPTEPVTGEPTRIEVPSPGEPIDLAEAGQRLGVDRSVLSKQVKSGLIPNRGSTEHPRIVLDEARQARADHLDPSKRRGPAAPLFGSDALSSPADLVKSDTETYQSARARQAAANAARAEIELAQLRGELMRVDAATQLWAAELENLIGAMEQFVVDLPVKLGLGREAVDKARSEFREFRARRAEQYRETSAGPDLGREI